MRRVNLHFSDEAYATLETIAAQRGITIHDIIREAINMEKWINDLVSGGARLLLERDGELREVVRTGK